MLFVRTICTSVVCVMLCFSTVNAQSLRNAADPAEVPPETFTQKQYVDSRGCVYVRAGYNGKSTWVPRVTASRLQMCGFDPTFPKTQVSNSNVNPNVQTVPVATVVVSVPNSVSTRNSFRQPLDTNVPSNFKPAWSDGRLNINRGPKTSIGNAQMGRTWTDTIPMRLVAN